MELYSFIGIVEFLNCSKLPAVSSTEKMKKEKTFLRSKEAGQKVSKIEESTIKF